MEARDLVPSWIDPVLRGLGRTVPSAGPPRQAERVLPRRRNRLPEAELEVRVVRPLDLTQPRQVRAVVGALPGGELRVDVVLVRLSRGEGPRRPPDAVDPGAGRPGRAAGREVLERE